MRYKTIITFFLQFSEGQDLYKAFSLRNKLIVAFTVYTSTPFSPRLFAFASANVINDPVDSDIFSNVLESDLVSSLCPSVLNQPRILILK